MSPGVMLLSVALAAGQPGVVDAPKRDFAPPVHAFHLRSIGPAVTSGRVAAFAVHPKDRSHFYAAVASGGVWKTTNGGTTWTPVFDTEGSYSVGAVTLDPQDANTVWVGSGENNSQRSVAYGDGVYRSTDGGKSWKNVGLKRSEHIARILVHPKNSDVVYVAAQGPLWGPGGDRGLFKTTNGGKSWERVLFVDDDTGVTDVVMDPRNPDVLVAASYQRRRHVWTLVNGGPGSGVHRTTDGGKTWTKITAGLPGVDLGRIGLAMAPSDPDTIYAQIEAAEKNGGIFRSTDSGKTWEKRNPFDSQAQYFCTPRVDPVNKDRLYVMNVVNQVSDDGGATLRALGEADKHVDSHDIWIDPADPKYYLCGCDGGVYESHDAGKTWVFKANLPVTQFYDVGVDQNPKSGPFYHVYGGTQDNYTLGGPVRTRSTNGIVNADWYVVQGGDGFHCKVDPDDPDTVYAEYQYAGIVRFNRKTGNRVDIRPIAGKGEPPLRWNWDSPFIISPHNSKRLYFAANKLFRTDDRGDSWTAVSPDLTRQLDRDRLKVFGKIQSPEAVAKNVS
ncbi:MAG: glycosyl hydrolase, partial [Gemmataceae bacterium]